MLALSLLATSKLRVLRAFGPRGRFGFGIALRCVRLWQRLNYVFYEPFGLEGASEALKRFGRSKTTCFTSVSDARALRPLKNNVFYYRFDRSTDRERASSFRTHAKTLYFTSFSIDRPIDRIARSSETLEKTTCFTSLWASRTLRTLQNASDALKLRVLRAFRMRVRFDRSKTTYFTTVSTDRPIASALRAFENTQKQCILQAFRSTNRSTESLYQSKHAKI